MKRLHSVTALSCLLSAAAITNHASAWSGTQDLISPKTCQTRNGRLVLCQIATSTLTGATPETAVPLRAVVQVNKAGDCSTPYSPQIQLSIPGEPSAKLSYLREPSLTLRHRDGSVIGRITVQDVPPWTGRISVPTSCRISLSVTVDEPDVYSKEEAQALIVKLERELARRQAEADSYQALVLYQQGFLFLQQVADNFHAELTKDIVQELRRGALSAKDSIVTLASACDDKMDQNDRANITLLVMSLPQLGDAADWTNPDGTTKSIADLIGPEAENVYTTVDRLARENRGGSSYDASYKAAAAEVVRAQQKLALAKRQLAAWL